MELGLAGKCVLVTGGSKGLGLAIAREFAAEGANVAIVSRTEKDLREVAERISKEFGRQAIPIAADLSRLDEVQRAVKAAVAGLGRIDVLVNNAGICRDRMFAILRTPTDEKTAKPAPAERPS